MSAITETCSVCTSEFDVTFRYQMEERDDGFAFFCTQGCLQKSQRGRQAASDTCQVCDACRKHFEVKLVSEVLYTEGRRKYACSMDCRKQLLNESQGQRLGSLVAVEHLAEQEVTPAAIAAPSRLPLAEPIAQPAVMAKPGIVTAPQANDTSVRNAAPARPGYAPRRIAVFNHKGGTGKTTTSVSLAAGLAERGHRVLLVDTDSQGNVAVSLGTQAQRSLYHVLVMGIDPKSAVTTVRPNFDLLPSNETLAAAELYLAGRKNRDRVLAQRLEELASGYDYVVIDCSPSLSLMNQNALVFADSVLVPVACDYLSLVGVRQVIKTVKNVNRLLKHRLQIWGVLPTFYDSRANICTEALETLRDHFGERCLPPVRATTKLKEAPAQAKSIFEHAPGTNGATDYAILVEQVLAHAASEQGTQSAQSRAS